MRLGGDDGPRYIGVSPSGKATDFDSVRGFPLRRFESYHPSSLPVEVYEIKVYGSIVEIRPGEDPGIECSRHSRRHIEIIKKICYNLYRK